MAERESRPEQKPEIKEPPKNGEAPITEAQFQQTFDELESYYFQVLEVDKAKAEKIAALLRPLKTMLGVLGQGKASAHILRDSLERLTNRANVFLKDKILEDKK